MKKIDAHQHLAQIDAGYCRRGELRAIGGGLMGCHDPFDLAGSKMRPLFDIIESHHAPVALMWAT